MKVLQVTTHLGGGVGKAIAGLISMVDKNNIEHEVLILEELINEKYKNKLLLNGIKVNNINNIVDLKKYMNTFDIIIINWWNNPVMSNFLMKFPEIKTRIVLWSHVNGNTYPCLPVPFLQIFHKVLFTSEFSYENSLWSKEEKKQIREISNVIYGFGDFDPTKMLYKNKYSINKKINVGYIGTLNYSKMNKNFINISEKIINFNKNIEFNLYGEIGNDLLNDINKSKNKDKFIINGYSNEVNNEMLKMDIFGYILDEDNYGTTENVLLEAMAVGLPIITLNQNSEKYIIKDKYSGILANDYFEYINKLVLLSQNEKAREYLGKNARRTVIKNFNSISNVNKYISICNDLLNKEKTHINFNELIGYKPIEWFLYFSGKYVNLLKKILYDEEEKLLCKLPPIFIGYNKGSIINFSNVFNYDCDLSKLKKMVEIFKRKEGIC